MAAAPSRIPASAPNVVRRCRHFRRSGGRHGRRSKRACCARTGPQRFASLPDAFGVSGRPVATGRIHPASQTLREIYDIWAEMGFQVFRSRDVEDDETNFALLNMPPHHPARDLWDTFHTTQEGVILRTHTSPGQIHAMRQFAPEPIRVILPGMVNI